ncbi:Probable carotenoid cleavage dioxygenase 4, chloroplastic [Dionaea muscipula]
MDASFLRRLYPSSVTRTRSSSSAAAVASASSTCIALHSSVSSVRIFEDKPKTQTSTITTTTTKRLNRSTNRYYPKIQSPSPTSTPEKKQEYRLAAAQTSASDIQQLSLIPSTIFNAFDDIINKFIDPPVQPSVDPRFVLSGNFAPVDELPPTECEVIEGALPPCLDGGAYIRNGPNPQFLPRGPYHLFDGDGMLHCLRISGGRATFCSRYVQTYKYTMEQQAGTSLLPSVFSGFQSLAAFAARGALAAARVAAGQYDLTNGFGVANTSLALLGRQLFALGESDVPYKIRITPQGDIETVGRHDFDGKLFMSMTAHPKVDPDTGEAFAFRYGPMPPSLTYFRFNSAGGKHPDVPIFSLLRAPFLHDFAVTKKYVIFPDIQLGMEPFKLITGGSVVASDVGKVPRLGVLPRYAVDEREMRWFDVPGFNIIHAVNAWDEKDDDTGNDSIVMVAPNILSLEHTFDRMDLIHCSMEKVRIDLTSGMVSRHPISTRNLDMAVINPAYVAKKNRYVYGAVEDPPPYVCGVVKLDVAIAEGDRRECIVASRMYGPGCYGGEPFFVARTPEDPDAEEDDGYVVSYVHDERRGESRFVVMDAKSPTLDVVASVRLPQRVPYGFHGLFVRDEDLQNLI